MKESTPVDSIVASSPAGPGHLSRATDVASLSRALLGADPGLVMLALGVLQGLGLAAEAAVPSVLPLLDHPDRGVQRAAINALARLGGRSLPVVMPRLLSERLAREHLDVLLRAFIDLRPMATAAVSVAAAACHHHRGHVRTLALRALEALEAPVLVLAPCIRVAKLDRHAAVRALARRMSARLVVVM